MSMVWESGQFTWAFVASVIYLVILLFAVDLLWRLTSLGGWRLLYISATAAIAGVFLLIALFG